MILCYSRPQDAALHKKSMSFILNMLQKAPSSGFLCTGRRTVTTRKWIWISYFLFFFFFCPLRLLLSLPVSLSFGFCLVCHCLETTAGMNEMQAGAEGDSCSWDDWHLLWYTIYNRKFYYIFFFLRIMLLELLKKLQYPCKVVPFCFWKPITGPDCIHAI